MINLLPPDLKQDYRYARRNRRLLFWTFAFAVAIGGVIILTGVGLLAMNNSVDNNKEEIAQLDTRLASEDLAGTQKQVTAISGNLKLMSNVLSKEILFSELLTRLGTITPPGVVLTNLSISQTAGAIGAIDITARSVDYGGAARLQANLADPNNQIFSKADTISISCADAESTGIAAAYPCSVSIRALFAQDNPFLFINTQKAAH